MTGIFSHLHGHIASAASTNMQKGSHQIMGFSQPLKSLFPVVFYSPYSIMKEVAVLNAKGKFKLYEHEHLIREFQIKIFCRRLIV